MKKINKLLIVVMLLKLIGVSGNSLVNSLYLINKNFNEFGFTADSEIDRLNAKIQQLNFGIFDPFKFELVKAEIQGSFTAKKITSLVKESLLKDVNSILASRIYSECDKFLIKTSGNCSNEIKWLNLLESKIGRNQKITTYKNKLNEQLRQIELYNYYTISLPKEIRKWINSGEVNFDTNTYSKFCSLLSNMPANFRFKNESKLIKVHSELRNELDLFAYRWKSTDKE